MVAAAVLAINIAILPTSIRDESVNAKFVTNMAIVNPIPPNIPAPISCLVEMFFEMLAIPNFSANRLKLTIPNGLPNTKPANMPKAKG